MAQTKKKRRRKHRGTQGGRVDTRPKGRPRNRAEARQRAQARRSGGGKRQAAGGPRTPSPPTWRGSLGKAAIAGAIFFALMALAFQRPIAASLGIAGFMLAFYIPMAYYTDRFFYNRHLRKQQAERAARSSGGE